MTTANPNFPENRIFFDGPHHTAVNDYYHLMRESNAKLGKFFNVQQHVHSKSNQ